MKIKKAVEHLKGIGPHRGTLSEDDLKAIQLGIEALNRIQHCRKWSTRAVFQPLNNETPEDR